jgi:hypothetical protein
MAQQTEPLPLDIHYGYTENKIVLRFTRATDHVLLSPTEAQSLVASVKMSIKKFADYRKMKGNH